MLSLIIHLFVLFCAFIALGQSPSNAGVVVKQENDGSLQAHKSNQRCSQFFYEGIGVAKGTLSLVSGQFERVKYIDELLGVPQKHLFQVGDDWAQSTDATGKSRVELIYDPTDDLDGTFVCRWAMNLRPWSPTPGPPQPIYMSLGIRNGAGCTTGDELNSTYVVGGIYNLWSTISGADRITLSDGDHLCLMTSTFGGDPNTGMQTSGFSIECMEQPVTGADATCYQ